MAIFLYDTVYCQDFLYLPSLSVMKPPLTPPTIPPTHHIDTMRDQSLVICPSVKGFPYCLTLLTFKKFSMTYKKENSNKKTTMTTTGTWYILQTRKFSCVERKRHTTRHAISTCYAALSPGEWGTYPGRGVPTLAGGGGGVSTLVGVPTLAPGFPPSAGR